MQSIEDSNKKKLLENLGKLYPNIRVAELNTIYREFQKLAVKKTPKKTLDAGASLKSDSIDITQFKTLFYHHFPHLETANDSNEPILNMMFKKKKRELMGFEDFIELFALIWRGTLTQKFLFVYSLIHTNEQQITKPNFRTVLDVLYRVSFAGTTEWEHNSLRLDMFVDIVFESIKGHQDKLDYLQFEEMILKTNVLEDFWAQLYKGM